MPEPTPSQARAIAARGDVVVSAGAGSGKTMVLVERFVGLVREGLEPERILTITFTDKAAGEMAERIARALQREGRADARRVVEGAWISTIHGFCARLLREHALEAGVDPAFSVLTDVPAARLRRAAFLEAQRRFRAERPGAYDGLVERVRWGKDEDGATSIRRRVLEVYDAVRAAGADLGLAPDVEAAPGEAAGERGASAGRRVDGGIDALWTDGLQAALARLALATAAFVDAAGRVARRSVRLERQVLAVREAAEEVAAAPLDAFRPEVWRRLDGLCQASRGAGGPLAAELLALHEAARAAAGAYAEGPSRALGRGLADLLRRFDVGLRELKAAQSALDFADLEERTRQLLEGRPDVRDAVQARFDAVMVDEFQDTSRVQQRIVDLVRRPGAFFAVGDPKQSIYGFRHADVKGLLEVERQVRAGGGEVVPLDTSFRTRPEVLAFVDEVFALAWAEPGSEVPHAPLVAGAAFAPVSGPAVELVLGRGETMERARAVEARAVAARLATIVEGKQLRGTNPLRKETFDRPLRYRDCAVLLPATTALPAYERALRERGVPYRVAGGRGFYAAREVIDAVALLQVVAAGHDDLALATVLRSPAVALSDDALLALAERRRRRRPGGGPGSLLEALEDEGAGEGLAPLDARRLAAGRALVADLRALRGRASARDVLERGLVRGGLLDGPLLRQGDPRGAANLVKLLGVVEELEREGAAGPAEVAAILEDLRLSGAREAEANVAGEEEDAVSVLTIHAAKGLEWPLVVVADLGRHPRQDQDPVQWTEATGVIAALRDPDRPDVAVVPASMHRLADEVRRRAREESKRLLYVAMTRAQDHLVLAGAQASRVGEWLLWARGPFVGAPRPEPPLGERDAAAGGMARRLVTRGGVAVRFLEADADQDGTPIHGPRGPTAGARPVLDAARAAALGRGEPLALPPVEAALAARAATILDAALAPGLPAADQGASVYTVSEVLTWAACPRRHLLEHVVGEPEPAAADAAALADLEAAGWPVEPVGRGGERDDVPPDVLGTLVHEVLAGQLGRRPPPARVAERLGHLLAQRPGPALGRALLVAVAGRALDLARAFDRTEVGARAAQAERAGGEVQRELPFLVALRPDGPGDPALLRGSIDLAFREAPDGPWTIVDHKTSDVTAFEVPDRLDGPRLQLRLYALALEAWGRPPAEAHVAFLAPEVTCAIDVGPAARAQTRRLLARFVEARRTLELPATPGAACRVCPYAPACPAAVDARERLLT